MRRLWSASIVIFLSCASAVVAPLATTRTADAQETSPDPFKAKLVGNAAIAAKVAQTLGTIAKRSAPKGLTAEQRKGFDEQSRWLSDAAGRFAAMKKTMDAVLAKTKASPSELAQTSMQFVALVGATESEAGRWDGLAPACHDRHAAAVAAMKSP